MQALANEYQNILENASDIVDLRDNLLITYTTLPKAEIERIDKVLPDNIDTVRLALDLDNMAARHGISIKSIKTTTGEADDKSLIVLPSHATNYDRAVISFSFISNYQNFKSFIADIEKSLRIMDIRSITFQVGESSFYEYRVEVETYWLK